MLSSFPLLPKVSSRLALAWEQSAVFQAPSSLSHCAASPPPVRNEELPTASDSVNHTFADKMPAWFSSPFPASIFFLHLSLKCWPFPWWRSRTSFFFLAPAFLCFLTHSYSSDCEQSPHTVKSLSCFSDPCTLSTRQDRRMENEGEGNIERQRNPFPWSLVGISSES